MPLLNSFIETLISVGFSSERGLTLDSDSKSEGTPFTSNLKSSILAIITNNRAIYPVLRGSECIDSSYPPMSHSTARSSFVQSFNSDRSTTSSSLTSSIKIQKQHIIPISYEDLPHYCLPDGVQATYQREKEKIHHFVLTQDGKRTYAVVLTFQQSFVFKNEKPDDDGTYQIEDISSQQTGRSIGSKIPVAVIKKRNASPSPTPVAQPVVVTKTRSKIPSSYHNVNAAPIVGRSTSTEDLSKQSKPSTRHYETPTINSYLKSKSNKATPPPARVSRTKSQENISIPMSTSNRTVAVVSGTSSSKNTDTTTNTNTTAVGSGMRNRTGSTTPQPLQLKYTLSSSSTTSITSPTTPKQQSTEPLKPFFLPHCIVLISNQPYWTAMQDTLSIIHDEMVRSHVEPHTREYKKLIQKYAFLACNTPIPPVPWERFSLSFHVTTDPFVLTFDPPINANRSILDIDLSVLLITLNIGRLLDVLAAVFTEQPIIFFCSNYSTLVTTLECLLYLIYPLKWTHLYIPLVPDGRRDVYLDGSLGCYIKGAHPRHQSIVEGLNTSLTCNLESDKNVRVPSNIEFYSLPATKLSNFINPITQLLEEIKVARALKNAPSVARPSAEQQRELDRQQRYETNQKIITIFLDLMIDLCGDALEPMYWKVNPQQASPSNTLEKDIDRNKRQHKNLSPTTTTSTTTKMPAFNKERYLLPKTEGIDLEFYTRFVETIAFQNFLKQEMTSITPSAFKQTCQLRTLTNQDKLFYVNTPGENLDSNPLLSDLALCDTSATNMILPLPDWSSDFSTHYLDNCIDVFTVELDSVQQERSSAVLSTYAYLRGCARLARGEYLEGLRDLYLIENMNLFPQKYIETIVVPHLIDECLLDLFLHESFYINSPEWKKVRVRQTSQSMSIIPLTDSDSITDATPIQPSPDVFLDDWSIVPTTLTYQQFSEHVHRLSIILNEETTEALFKALLHWTEKSKTLKNEKTSNNNTPNKTSEPLKSANKFSPGSSAFTFHETVSMLADHRKGGNSSASTPTTKQQTTQYEPTVPGVLFETFFDVWQQLNTEKISMNRLLPEDRQKQESILKMSSQGIVSKRDGPGQIILTQKRLYFLPETRSSIRLLTELIHIVIVDKYQHQTIFSSSKPGLKIYTTTSSTSSSPSSSLPRNNSLPSKTKALSLERDSKQTSISLFFKTNEEQELWHTLIVELWSGMIIAHQQCDTAILNRASRHIALMDTLACIDYDEETISTNNRSSTNPRMKSKQLRNQVNLELALKELSIFTRMCQTGTLKPLSDETRRVLIRRLSPSINESERHAVRCLVFTENLETGRSSLWCAYGSKLKVFNVSTWICDPNDLIFPSTITCMCLDGRNKLWIQCMNGELFIVDTTTRLDESKLETNNGENSCHSITYDSIRNQIVTANRMGILKLWNASNWQCLTDINLLELYQKANNIQPTVTTTTTVKKPLIRKPAFFTQSKDISDMSLLNNSLPTVNLTANDRLERIQVYNDLLFACYREDYIVILRMNDSNTYKYEHSISVKYKTGNSILIDSFLVYNEQIWISTGCIVSVYTVKNNDQSQTKQTTSEDDDNGYNLIVKRPVEDDNIITMLGFDGYLWAGSLNGNVYVFRMDNYELYKTFTGHHDRVWSLCSMFDMYVVSGSAQNDTSIAIWENVRSADERLIVSQKQTQRNVIRPTDLL